MADKQFVNTQMPRDLVRLIDAKRAERTLKTGRAVSRGDIVRECLEQSLGVSFTPGPLNVKDVELKDIPVSDSSDRDEDEA